MKVEKINDLNFDKVYKILTSNSITETQKTNFVIANRTQIKNIMENSINHVDFKTLMQNRTIQKFRPLKNSYTKMGDKIILAKALGIPTNKLPAHIKDLVKKINEIEDLNSLNHSTMEMIKTYIYRHGTKDEIVTFLDYELTVAKDKVKCLYKNLQYYSGGIADYFIRPIHRMDNKTLIKVYSVINKGIKSAEKNGEISSAESKKIAKWALIQIYKIQNNSKLLNAIKTYDILK